MIVVRTCNHCIYSHWKIFQAGAGIQWAIWTVVRGEFLLHHMINHPNLLQALWIAPFRAGSTHFISNGLHNRGWVFWHHQKILLLAIVGTLHLLCHLLHLWCGEHDLGFLNWCYLACRRRARIRLKCCWYRHHLSNNERSLQLLFCWLLLDCLIVDVIACSSWREGIYKVGAEARSTDRGCVWSRWCTRPRHQLFYPFVCVNIHVASVGDTIGLFIAALWASWRWYCQHLLLFHLLWVESVCYHYFFLLRTIPSLSDDWIRVRHWCTLFLWRLRDGISLAGLTGKCLLTLFILIKVVSWWRDFIWTYPIVALSLGFHKLVLALLLLLFAWWSSFLLFWRNSLFF